MKIPKLNYKRIFLFTSFILLAIFFSWLIYKMFFNITRQKIITQKNYKDYYNPKSGLKNNLKKNNSGGLTTTKNKNINTNSTPLKNNINNLPIIKNVTKITKEIAKGVTMDKTGNNIIYYNNKNGKFYKIHKNGVVSLLSDKSFFGAQKISWSPDKNKTIIKFLDGSNIIYNFSTNKQITLPSNWENTTFTSNKKIITKSFDKNQNNNLIIADTINGQAIKLEEMNDKTNNFQISISPTNQIVAFFKKNIDLTHQEIFPIGQNNEKFKSFIVNGQGFWGKWSPNGEKILYSVYNINEDYKPNLWIANKFGSAQKRIFVDTWAEKCTFVNSNILYCAVPQKLKRMMGLSPQYAINIDDDIYKIDININRIEKIKLPPKSSYNIKNIIITNNEKELYFINNRTKRIYKINL